MSKEILCHHGWTSDKCQLCRIEREKMKNTDHTLKFDDLKRTTGKAHLFLFKARKTSQQREIWIAKSVILNIELEKGEIEVPEWLVEKDDLWDWSI